MKDLSASILAKLKNQSNKIGIEFSQVLLLFFQEEFLRRLSKSKYVDNLILKGGLFIFTMSHFQSRSTVDADFMATRLDNNLAHMDSVMSEILQVKTEYNDIVALEIAKSAQPISINREYHGIRTQIMGRIKKTKVLFDIDIGVGDTVYPPPQKHAIPTVLDTFEEPTVYTYSIESTIAEKLNAIFERFEMTSRMKDFYDIYYLAKTFDFDGQILREAISETMSSRGTEYDNSSMERVKNLYQNQNIQVRWRSFQKKIKKTELQLEKVLSLINGFICPVVETLVDNVVFNKQWRANERKWE
jgi:predicted nucleotidyltransferase component of viral defense system